MVNSLYNLECKGHIFYQLNLDLTHCHILCKFIIETEVIITPKQCILSNFLVAMALEYLTTFTFLDFTWKKNRTNSLLLIIFLILNFKKLVLLHTTTHTCGLTPSELIYGDIYLPVHPNIQNIFVYIFI